MGRKISASFISDNEGYQLNIKALILGLIRSFFITLGGAAFLLTGAIISEAEAFYFSDLLTLIVIFSVLIGGFKAGIAAGKKGWLHGILVSLVYTLIFMLFGLLFYPLGYNLVELMLQIFALSIIGALGGIVGVNLKDYSQRQEQRKARIKEKYWSYHRNDR